MDNDVRPAKRPQQSLRAKLDALKTNTSTAEDFKTPDEVAADDDKRPLKIDDKLVQVDTSLPPDKPDKKASWRDKFHWSWPPGKKEWTSTVVVVLLCGSIAGF